MFWKSEKRNLFCSKYQQVLKIACFQHTLCTLYGLVFYIVISRNFLYDGGAFEHIFCPGGGEFEKSDFKKFKFPACARGGDVEVSNWSVH